MNNEMVKKFKKAINEVSDKYHDFPERNIDFCNKCSAHAAKRFNLNATASTEEQNAFQKALDDFFL